MKKANEMNKVVELTQDTAKATLDTTVEVAKLAENSIQGLYKVGYDMNASGLSVAKGYWDALSAIRNEWINLFQQTGEKAVDSIGTLNSIEIPFQKEVSDFGANVFAQGEKVFNMATQQVKSVANTVTAQVEKVTATATKEAKKATETVANKTEKAVKVTKDVVATAEKVTEKTADKTEKVVAKAKKAAASK
ncbi:MAG TPA: hypothetical protein PKY82_12270 [Pyrinomonadaceae bacterium]|nr:hypothetical protein [Pyrinomonadaceae bacterium]